MKRIYLDYAAASPVDPRVMEVMQPYFSEVFYNPSALYQGARESKAALELARQIAAQTIGARPSEIIFTAGGTESANLAIHGTMRLYPEGEVIVSAIEHDAVLRPSEMYTRRLAKVDSKGRVIVPELGQLINDKTVLISVMLVNNEIGTLQPVKELVSLVADVRMHRKANGNNLPIYVHTDACQAPLYLDINISKLGVDMMTINGGKIYGPKQSGLLYKKAKINLEPLIQGGRQEWGYRSGTENVCFAVGLSKALELAAKGKSDRVKRVTNLRDYFAAQLEERFDAQISGDRKARIANNVHARFKSVDNERVLFALDNAGVDAAAGSACSASSETSSHVLKAMGLSDDEARSSIRFTLGKETTETEIDRTLDILEHALLA